MLAAYQNRMFRYLKGNAEFICWLVLALMPLIPVWSFGHFPSADGPDLLQNAHILLSYAREGVLQRLYAVNGGVATNWTLHIITAALMSVFQGAIVEKILVSAYMIGMSIALRKLATTINSKSAFLSWLALPLVQNRFLHLGFYSFCFGLVFSVLFLSLWIRKAADLDRKSVLVLAALSTLTFLFHPFTFVMAAVLILLMLGWLFILHRYRPCADQTGPAVTIKSLLGTLVCIMPGGLLTLFFCSHQSSQSQAPHKPITILGQLFGGWMTSFSDNEMALGLAFSAVLIILIPYLCVRALKERKLHWFDGFLILTGFSLALAFFAPQGIGGGEGINERVVIYVFICLLSWIAGFEHHKLIKLAMQCCAAFLVLAGVSAEYRTYGELNSYLSEYLSVQARIQPGAIILPLCLSKSQRPDGKNISVLTDIFVHPAGYIATDRHAICLVNHEANTRYFPLMYRPQMNPYRLLGHSVLVDDPFDQGTLEKQPPAVDIPNYERLTGCKINCILVWDTARQWQITLPSDFQLVETSRPRGVMRLYQRALPDSQTAVPERQQ